MTERIETNKIIKVVKLVAQIILENGGETYRAEDTVIRICQSYGFTEVNPIAIPTGLFITISRDGIENHTIVKRVKNRTVDLSKVNAANNISRLLTEKKLTLDEAIVELEKLAMTIPPNKYLLIIASALTAGFFALLFKGNFFDFCIAALCGAAIQLAVFVFKGEDMNQFMTSLVGGLVTAIIALSAVTLFNKGNVELIIGGAIMPLLPGLAMTNAIRDTMGGDLVSGVARGAEAVFIATGLAVGVGVILKIFLLLGGGSIQ
ncbi:MAG: threonine/serine exporter family protein [Clostridia bacterium]|nr:threonine/serine exporter family protein [Clostridia bacterium]